MSAAFDSIHERYVKSRRLLVLRDRLDELLPERGQILDIGTGDGNLAYSLMYKRKLRRITGIDTLVREDTPIPVKEFGGLQIPYEDDSFDCAMFVDVLHHTNDPVKLLMEAARVSRDCVVIKDHLREGVLAGQTLRFMDGVGNRRFGVELPYNYLNRQEWNSAFAAAGLRIEVWTTRLELYPWWADWAFGRKLHFIARLKKVEGTGQ